MRYLLIDDLLLMNTTVGVIRKGKGSLISAI
jgi:hypothetical protein